MSVAVLFQREPWVSQFVCDSGNFFGYETRRVGGNIPEDYYILTERHRVISPLSDHHRFRVVRRP